MAKTRGDLVAARIYEVNDKGKEKAGGIAVTCMFNPYEYTVSKSNSFNEKPKRDADVPAVEFVKAGPQTLQLNLTFDTYETDQDVSQETRKLWKLMMTKTHKDSQRGKKSEPPQVAFEWGSFQFVAYITSMTQKFTLFRKNGMPVRAQVNVTFTQYTDVEDYKPQNPTSGAGEHEQIWRITAGDRLDMIAAEIYGDATKWRLIADYNKIGNPLNLHAGARLRIPLD